MNVCIFHDRIYFMPLKKGPDESDCIGPPGGPTGINGKGLNDDEDDRR